MQKPLVVLIAGGTCSGKTEFTKWFDDAIVLSLDNFYVGKDEMKADESGHYDFDSPDAIDLTSCANAVKTLLEKGRVTIPKYDMLTSSRIGTQEIRLSPTTKFLIVEGLFVLMEPIRKLGDLAIFLDTPMEIRVSRRLVRDIKRKGQTKLETLEKLLTIERRYEKYVEPTKKFANITIPFSSNPMKFSEDE